MADHPFGGAGPDLVEALLRGAMTSPHVAADPAGGQVVAWMLGQLAQRDSSRVERLLSPQPGASKWEIEIHRTGDIVPETVIRDLDAGEALREAARRAGDPQRSVEVVLVPPDGEDEVVLAARPACPLAYLFTDDVRAEAAKLPPPAPPAQPAAEPVRAGSEQAAGREGGDSATAVGAVAHQEGLVPATLAGPRTDLPQGELAAAIEAVLADMSIQVDVAGVAELVQEAVVEHLRAEMGGLGAQGGAADPDLLADRVAAHLAQRVTNTSRAADPSALAQQVATHLAENLDPEKGSQAAAFQLAVSELQRALSERDRQMAVDQARTQMQLEALHVQMQHTERSIAAGLQTLADHQQRAAGGLESVELHLQSTLRALSSLTRDIAGQNAALERGVDTISEGVEEELRLLARRLEASVDAAVSRVQPSGHGAGDLRRVASELSTAAERLGSLVRHLDTSVDVRSLGRIARSVERSARALGAGTAGTAEDTRADDPAPAGQARRARRAASAGDHPLRLVEDPKRR